MPEGRGSVLGWFRAMLAARRTRAELRRLHESGEHLLNDVGLDPEAVAAQLALPFWRAAPVYSMRKPSRLQPSGVRA